MIHHFDLSIQINMDLSDANELSEKSLRTPQSELWSQSKPASPME